MNMVNIIPVDGLAAKAARPSTGIKMSGDPIEHIFDKKKIMHY